MRLNRWTFGRSCFGMAEKKHKVLSPASKRDRTFSKVINEQQTLFHSLMLQYGKTSEGLISVEDYIRHKVTVLRDSIMEEEGGEWPDITRSKLVFIQELLYMNTITESDYHKAKRVLLQRLADVDADVAVTDFILDPIEMRASMDALRFSSHFRRLNETTKTREGKTPPKPQPQARPLPPSSTISLISRIFSTKKRQTAESSTKYVIPSPSAISSSAGSFKFGEARGRSGVLSPPVPQALDFLPYGNAPTRNPPPVPTQFPPRRELFPGNPNPTPALKEDKGKGGAPPPRWGKGSRVENGEKAGGKFAESKAESRADYRTDSRAESRAESRGESRFVESKGGSSSKGEKEGERKGKGGSQGEIKEAKREALGKGRNASKVEENSPHAGRRVETFGLNSPCSLESSEVNPVSEGSSSEDDDVTKDDGKYVGKYKPAVAEESSIFEFRDIDVPLTPKAGAQSSPPFPPGPRDYSQGGEKEGKAGGNEGETTPSRISSFRTLLRNLSGKNGGEAPLAFPSAGGKTPPPVSPIVGKGSPAWGLLKPPRKLGGEKGEKSVKEGGDDKVEKGGKWSYAGKSRGEKGQSVAETERISSLQQPQFSNADSKKPVARKLPLPESSSVTQKTEKAGKSGKVLTEENGRRGARSSSPSRGHRSDKQELTEKIQRSLTELRQRLEEKYPKSYAKNFMSDEDILAVAQRMPADKAELLKRFPKEWVERHGKIILQAVQHQVRHHYLAKNVKKKKHSSSESKGGNAGESRSKAADKQGSSRGKTGGSSNNNDTLSMYENTQTLLSENPEREGVASNHPVQHFGSSKFGIDNSMPSVNLGARLTAKKTGADSRTTPNEGDYKQQKREEMGGEMASRNAKKEEKQAEIQREPSPPKSYSIGVILDPLNRPVDLKARALKRQAFLKQTHKSNMRQRELKAKRVAEGLSNSEESPEFRLHLDPSDESGEENNVAVEVPTYRRPEETPVGTGGRPRRVKGMR